MRDGTPRAQLLFLVLVALLGALGVLPRLFGEANPDVAWYAYLADQLLEGLDLYTGIREVNPPWPVWATLPAAALANLTGFKTSLLFNATVLLLAFGVLAATSIQLRERGATRRRKWEFLAVVALALLLVPGYAFGQREHLAVVLSFPYLLSVALQRGGKRSGGTARGLLAGLGFAFKPHFVLVPVLAEGWARLRDGEAHRTIRGATLAMAGVLAAYAAAVLLLEPDYFTVLRELVLPIYPHFNPRPWWEGLTSVPALFTYVALAAACLRLLGSGDALGPAFPFVVYSLGWLAIAALQQQDMSYHYLPGLVHATVAVGAALTLRGLEHGAGPATEAGSDDRRSVGRAVAVAVAGAFGLVFSYMYAGELRVLAGEEPTEYERLRETVVSDWRPGPDGPEIAALNVGFGMVFTLLNDTGARWTLRYPGVWPILAARRKALSRGEPPPEETVAENGSPMGPVSSAERFFRDAIVRDLTAAGPDVFLVPESISRSHGERLDILQYLRRDSAFARWFREYRYRGTVAGLEVYLRGGAEGDSAVPPAQGKERGAERRPQGSDQHLLQAGDPIQELVERGDRHGRRAGRDPENRLCTPLDQLDRIGPVEKVPERFQLHSGVYRQAPEAGSGIAGSMLVDLVVARPEKGEGRDRRQHPPSFAQQTKSVPQGVPGPGQVLQHVGHDDQVEPAGHVQAGLELDLQDRRAVPGFRRDELPFGLHGDDFSPLRQPRNLVTGPATDDQAAADGSVPACLNRFAEPSSTGSPPPVPGGELPVPGAIVLSHFVPGGRCSPVSSSTT